MRYAAIVLAAGFSRRFGGDKRLACIDGEPMLLATLRNLQLALAGNCRADLQVVLRARDAVVGSMLMGLVREQPGCLARAPVWPVGMGVSIAAGLDALLERGCRPDAVAVCLADMPFVRPETLRYLLLAATAETICLPVYGGRRGHPVVFGKAFFAELSKLRGRRGAEKILRAHPQAVRELVVEDPGVSLDIDRPEDFHAAARRDPAGRTGTALDTAEDVLLAPPWG